MADERCQMASRHEVNLTIDVTDEDDATGLMQSEKKSKKEQKSILKAAKKEEKASRKREKKAEREDRLAACKQLLTHTHTLPR
eukprot:5946648-Amphidinium_carterae.1